MSQTLTYKGPPLESKPRRPRRPLWRPEDGRGNARRGRGRSRLPRPHHRRPGGWRGLRFPPRRAPRRRRPPRVLARGLKRLLLGDPVGRPRRATPLHYLPGIRFPLVGAEEVDLVIALDAERVGDERSVVAHL